MTNWPEVKGGMLRKPNVAREYGAQEAEVPSNVFTWFAYFDHAANEARAVSGSLALYVIRPKLSESVRELKALMKDYISHEWTPELDPEDFKRELPSEVWEAHVNGYCLAQTTYLLEQGSKWDCGGMVVNSRGKIKTLSQIAAAKLQPL